MSTEKKRRTVREYMEENARVGENAWDKVSSGMSSGAWTNIKNAGIAMGMTGTIGTAGVKRTDAMNALGFLTKHQRESVFRKTDSGASMVDPKTLKPRIKVIGGLSNAGVAGFGLYGLAESEDLSSWMTDYVAPAAASMTGWRVGSSLGYAAGQGVKASTSGVPLLKWGGKAAKPVVGVATGVAGALGAGIAASAAMGMVTTLAESDNAIRGWAQSRRHQSINNHDYSRTEVSSMFTGERTQRMAAMSKLSKSGLNDRGQLMGNEAMVMRGVM